MFHVHQHLNTSERNWSERLENVLNDYDALNLFKSWMGVDEDSSEHPIRLHFAIIAYKDMVEKNDPRCLQLAKDIYNKFLRQKLGLCAFVDSAVRESIGRKMRQLSGEAGVGPANLFDPCLQQVDIFLRRQHALFVSSQEFLDFFNSSMTLQDIPEGGSSGAAAHASSSKAGQRKSRRCYGEGFGAVPRLTASSLMRSQRDRETALGQSSVEKMFKPVCKYPYVGNATTSKNDSAVSSSFSSDANAAQHHAGNTIRMTREEHRRINPVLANFPRPDPPTVSSTNQFRHDVEEGRRKFAEMLIEKLHVVIAKYKQYERMNEQIEKIAQGPKCSARDLIISSSLTGDGNLGMEDCTAGLDADDDVDNYFKQRMLPDSANSQQSPQIPQSRRTRRRSIRSTSPDNSNAVLFAEPTTTSHQKQQSLITQSYINTNSMECPLDFSRQPTNYLNAGDEMGTSIRFSQQQGVGISANDVRFNHRKSCSPNRLNVINTGYNGMMATTSYYGDAVISPNVVNMSQSAYVCPNSNRQNKMGFAPPPGSAQIQHQTQLQLKQKDGYCENDEDTSGIGSMTTHFTSTYFSDHSTNSYNKQRAAVFKKARQLSSAQGQQIGGGNQPKSQMKSGLLGENKKKMTVQEFSQSLLSRPKQNDVRLSSPSAPKMTISYKPSMSGDKDVIPVVANIPQRTITFKEFRRHLSIPSKDRRQFFFKTSCEDGSAPYQLLLVNDDSAILPVFEGKVSAECRSLSEDSE